MWDNTSGKRLRRYGLDSTRSGTPKWRALVKTKPSAFTITQIATRIVYWILRPVKKRTAWKNYILCLYSENICIVRTAPSLRPSLLVAPLQQNSGININCRRGSKWRTSDTARATTRLNYAWEKKTENSSSNDRGNRFRWKHTHTHTHTAPLQKNTFLSLFLSLPSYLLP